jgi:hypothetical protein
MNYEDLNKRLTTIVSSSISSMNSNNLIDTEHFQYEHILRKHAGNTVSQIVNSESIMKVFVNDEEDLNSVNEVFYFY